MELATIELKLSGQTANTVVKHDVTPPQVAIYAMMHGEDCIQSLKVTGEAKERTVPKEMERLRIEFVSDHSIECIDKLFPGRFPHLPTTFRAIGFDPAYLAPHEPVAPVVTPQAKNQTEASIIQKIKEGSSGRQEEEAKNPKTNDSDVAILPPVDHSQAVIGAEDDDEPLDNAAEFDDDPLDAELEQLEQQDQTEEK